MSDIVVSDYRQTGKTERIVWMVVGGILAGAAPKVVVSGQREAKFLQRRILAALAKIGQDTPEHNGRARLAVVNTSVAEYRPIAEHRLRGAAGPIYREVSYE